LPPFVATECTPLPMTGVHHLGTLALQISSDRRY